MKLSFSVLKIRGIDVRVHVTFVFIVLFGALVWAQHGPSGSLFGAALMLLVFGCVLLHELGHALLAQRLGLTVREIVLFPLGGMAVMVGAPRRLWHEVAIAAAGPAVNVVLAVAFGVWIALRGDWASIDSLALPAQLAPSASTLLLGLFGANATLAMFNLLPFFPLDGGRILRALLAMRVGRRRATEWAGAVGQAGAAGLLVWSVASLQLLLGFVAVFLYMAAAQERRQARSEPLTRQLRAEDIAELPTLELHRETSIAGAARSLLRSGQRVLPVIDGARVVGLVTREAVCHAALDRETAQQSIMSIAKAPLFVEGSHRADLVLAMLAAQQCPAAVVTSDSVLLGLVVSPEANERVEIWAALERTRGTRDARGSLADDCA